MLKDSIVRNHRHEAHIMLVAVTLFLLAMPEEFTSYTKLSLEFCCLHI